MTSLTLSVILIMVGFLGIALVIVKAPDAWLVAWALLLLGLNFWLADSQRHKKKVSKE